MFKTVTKKNGKKESFNLEKIKKGIIKSAQDVNEAIDNRIEVLLKSVSDEVLKKREKEITTNDIGDIVEKILIQSGLIKVSQSYIRFRENKRNLSQDKEALGIKDDIGLSYNTLYILKQRYLKRNEKNEILETPKGMITRVAKFLSSVEKTKKLKDKWFKEFYDVMVGFDFLPGTRPLANAGKKEAQLGNCFVWPMEDDINFVFKVLHQSTLIKKHGGGCGYNFSKIRPEGDTVAGIPNLAAGPVKMIEMFDLMTSLFKQEGRYESGNMAVLNASHPDIFNFISAKKTDGYLSKSNLSVGITDEFMKAAVNNRDWDLINPRTGEVVNVVNAKSILELMAQMAWGCGDPGILNLSAINKGDEFGNPLLKKHGPIVCTNVCGEIPQYPYESCNLGYVNFTKFVDKNTFDFKRLEKVMTVAVRLMDNVIEASWFPVEEVRESVRNHRRIGIGCVGWAETLAVLNIPYDSKEAYLLAEKITKTMYESAFDASVKLAEEKEPFPLVNDSIWASKKRKPRNVALLTFPPSSGNAVISETSFGIEPYFALAYEQNVMGGMRLKTTVPLFVKALKEANIYTDEIIQKVIENHGSCQGIKEVPISIQKRFKVAHDINWRDHIKMQAAFQKWTDNAITKTINMPGTATPQDVEDAYVMAWKLGCKGLTIYRDKSKENQVFEFGEKKEEPRYARKCPNCDIKLYKEGKCYKCKKCGYSTCEI